MKIDVDSVFFSYTNTPVLNGVDLHVADAELVCIVGPNGSGKSTLIKCIESLLLPHSGTISLDGKDCRTLHRMEIAQMLAYVPQSTNHSFSTTVFDTVLMGRRPYSSWHTSEEDIDKVTDIIGRMDLDEIALQDFNCLSGGQQQRVLIARALAQEPKALLLDEPTSALDIAYQLEVMDIIQDLVAEHSLSVVMIVHDLNLASRYADRIVLLDDGKVYADGAAVDVFTEQNIAQVYGIEAVIREIDGELSIHPVGRCGVERRDGQPGRSSMN